MKTNTPQLLVSDRRGGIHPIPGLEATGMKAGKFFRLLRDDCIPIPPGSQLFMLPERIPVGYEPKKKAFLHLKEYCAVAAFTPPGFTVTYNSAYNECARPRMLPLFSYAACAFHNGRFYVAAVNVDRDIRHDARFINMRLAEENAKRFRKLFQHNRLIRHLESCAFKNLCPNAQNFFLGRFEAPLPTSPRCNAGCAGCISYQPKISCPPAQPRINFIPTPEEVSEVALFHIERAADPIVSFGQGCEGEPLLAGPTIEKAIRLIRKRTEKGTIHINTNGSRPEILERLFDAGVDSIRVSFNSVRRLYYERYFRPKGYTFKDVISSLRIANEKGRFISLNYLTVPGFTDSRDEFRALKNLLESIAIDMIQWRNLNFDPVAYFKRLRLTVRPQDMLGVKEIISKVETQFSKIRIGYFNPPKRAFRRYRRTM